MVRLPKPVGIRISCLLISESTPSHSVFLKRSLVSFHLCTKCALAVQLVSDFGSEQAARGFLIRGSGSLLAILGKGALDQGAGQLLVELAGLGQAGF